jgi:DNA-binding MarR family transcriptional regulator
MGLQIHYFRNAGKARKRDCHRFGRAYIVAQAMIACAIIVLTGDRDMRPFYRASDYGMKNSVGYLVRRTSNLMVPQMEALFADKALTFSQWTVLMALREWGHSTSAELARDICHDAGSLTRILDELEQRDLIARVRSETDRRMVSLSMTPQGLVLVETLLPRVVEHWNTLLGDFSHLEIKQLIKLLGRLTMAVEGRRDEIHARARNRQDGPAGPLPRNKENREHRHRRGHHP